MIDFKLREFELDIDKAMDKRKLGKGSPAQKFVDSEVLRYCDPFVPKDQRFLVKSGKTETTIGSGVVRYKTDYAHYQYYNHEKKSLWFEKMKAQYKKVILRGAKEITGAK